MDKVVKTHMGRKYVAIYQELRQQLLDGSFHEGERLPTEKDFSEKYAVSRPTVTKALNALASEGLISRKTGSGSYVQPQTKPVVPQLFGLLIPGLGRGEVFEPICAQIAATAEKHDYSLLWSGFGKNERMHPLLSEAIARRYIDTGIAGVFFQPLELWPEYAEMNEKVIAMLEAAKIPVVLIDADYKAFPDRSPYDLIALDNVKAGYHAAQHLISQGARRLDFFARPHSADSVALRRRGYCAALYDSEIYAEPSWIHTGYPEDARFVQDLIQNKGAEDLICANDETAASLMSTLHELKIAVPEEVRIVGFDDVRYSQHLKVSLTTIRQPCEELGRSAVETMLWRLANPERPARSILASGSLVVRQSSLRS
ncbi:GntR family transcriptional regulator [Treponema sp.]